MDDDDDSEASLTRRWLTMLANGTAAGSGGGGGGAANVGGLADDSRLILMGEPAGSGMAVDGGGPAGIESTSAAAAAESTTWSLLMSALFYRLDADKFDVNWFNFILALVLVMLMLTTAVGNLFVIVAILIERNLRTIGNYLVLSLAIADLLVACLVMPLAGIYQILERWTLGVLLCDIWTSADVFCCTASILHLLAIALDRYWAVTRVDYIRCQRNERRILFMIFFVWMAACIISLAPVFGWKDAQFEWRITNDHECLISQDIGYQIFATCTTFYFPLTLTLIFYWKIYQVARKRIRRKPGNRVKISLQHPSPSSSTSSPGSKQQQKLLANSSSSKPKPKQQRQLQQPSKCQAIVECSPDGDRFTSSLQRKQIASVVATNEINRQSCHCSCHLQASSERQPRPLPPPPPPDNNKSGVAAATTVAGHLPDAAVEWAASAAASVATATPVGQPTTGDGGGSGPKGQGLLPSASLPSAATCANETTAASATDGATATATPDPLLRPGAGADEAGECRQPRAPKDQEQGSGQPSPAELNNNATFCSTTPKFNTDNQIFDTTTTPNMEAGQSNGSNTQTILQEDSGSSSSRRPRNSGGLVEKARDNDDDDEQTMVASSQLERTLPAPSSTNGRPAEAANGDDDDDGGGGNVDAAGDSDSSERRVAAAEATSPVGVGAVGSSATTGGDNYSASRNSNVSAAAVAAAAAMKAATGNCSKCRRCHWAHDRRNYTTGSEQRDCKTTGSVSSFGEREDSSNTNYNNYDFETEEDGRSSMAASSRCSLANCTATTTTAATAASCQRAAGLSTAGGRRVNSRRSLGGRPSGGCVDLLEDCCSCCCVAAAAAAAGNDPQLEQRPESAVMAQDQQQQQQQQTLTLEGRDAATGERPTSADGGGDGRCRHQQQQRQRLESLVRLTNNNGDRTTTTELIAPPGGAGQPPTSNGPLGATVGDGPQLGGGWPKGLRSLLAGSPSLQVAGGPIGLYWRRMRAQLYRRHRAAANLSRAAAADESSAADRDGTHQGSRLLLGCNDKSAAAVGPADDGKLMQVVVAAEAVPTPVSTNNSSSHTNNSNVCRVCQCPTVGTPAGDSDISTGGGGGGGAGLGIAAAASTANIAVTTVRPPTTIVSSTSVHIQQSIAEGIESKRERKAAKTLAIITGVFVMCWLPFFVMAITMPLLNLKPHKYVFALMLWLGYVNSMLNPIIYTIFSPDFRKAFKRLLCGLDAAADYGRRQSHRQQRGCGGQAPATSSSDAGCWSDMRQQLLHIQPALAKNCRFPSKSHQLGGGSTSTTGIRGTGSGTSNNNNNNNLRNQSHLLSLSKTGTGKDTTTSGTLGQSNLESSAASRSFDSPATRREQQQGTITATNTTGRPLGTITNDF